MNTVWSSKFNWFAENLGHFMAILWSPKFLQATANSIRSNETRCGRYSVPMKVVRSIILVLGIINA